MSLVTAYSAFEFRETGARAVGMSGAFTAQSTDATAPYWNPAGLRAVPQIELASFYTQFYSLSDLSYLGVGLAAPSPFGGIGLAFSQLGPSDYREHQLYISHAIELVDQVYLGYNLKGQFLRIEEFGSAAAFGLDTGILARVTKNLQVGIVGKNMNRPTIGASKESLPTGFVTGVAFQPLKGLWLTGDFERIDPQPASLKSGVEFMLAPYFTLRGGVQNNPSKFSGGMGAQAGIVNIDYAYFQHGTLSGQHQFTLTFKFGKTKERVDQPRRLELKKKKPQGGPDGPATEEKMADRVNLNTVTVEDLTQIPNIGLVTAGKIIEYRTQHGFKTIDDLLKVPDMRRNIFNILKKHAYIEGDSIQEKPEEAGDEEFPMEMEEGLYDEEEFIDPVIETAEPEPLKIPAQTEEIDSGAESVPKQDLNHITPEELSGLGLSTAQIKNILRVRTKKGEFKSMEELKKLPGIDQKTFERLKNRVDVK